MSQSLEPISLNVQWNTISIVLSLDVSTEFFRDLVIPTNDHVRLQRQLRSAILQFRQVAADNHLRVTKISDVFVDHLEVAELSPFLKWGERQYLGYHAEQPHFSAWDIIVSHWAFSRSQDIAFLPPETLRWFKKEYRSSAVVDDIRTKSARIGTRPLSDWDLEMYARHKFGPTWEASPYATIESMVRGNRLIRFLVQFSTMLGIDDQFRIQKCAESLLAEFGVWMPSELCRLTIFVQEYSEKKNG